MSPTVEEIKKAMDAAETEAGSLGGSGAALFAKITTQYGYKVFATGSHEETFFETPFPPTGVAAKAALELAKACQASKGVTTSPAFSWVLSIAPQDVVGKSVTWKGPQHKVVNRWKKKIDEKTVSALDDIVLPELIKLGCEKPASYFVRIRYMRNIVNPGTDDNPQLLWLPAEVFKNEGECRAAAEKWKVEHPSDGAVASAAADSTAFPPGYDAASWGKFKSQIDTALKAGTPPAKVASDWGITDVGWMVNYASTLK